MFSKGKHSEYFVWIHSKFLVPSHSERFLLALRASAYFSIKLKGGVQMPQMLKFFREIVQFITYD